MSLTVRLVTVRAEGSTARARSPTGYAYVRHRETEREVEITKKGIIRVDGYDFNEYPPPQSLVKAMNRVFAIQFRDYGILRMHNLTTYRKWENEALGDAHDGKGLFHVNGHPYSMATSTPMFASCLSLPTITPNRLVYLAAKGQYDCVVAISSTDEFLKRIRKWKACQKPQWWLHCGLINYTRGNEVTIDMVNNQKPNHNVFQKDPSFAEDMEYRISLMNTDMRPKEYDYVEVSLGNCADIVTISDLPNQAL